MALWPRAFATFETNNSFEPLFRFLDDFDKYRYGDVAPSLARSQLKTFNPKFDVKELPNSYELHGELPGIEQKDIEIQFTDSQTLSIRGRSERSYASGSPTSNLIEGKRGTDVVNNESESAANEKQQEAGETDVSTEVAKKQGEGTKYWVSERSIGEFARSFGFPGPVDQEHVTASMKNGVLSIVVPKAPKTSNRKIAIH